MRRVAVHDRVAYALKRRWKDGTTHVVLTAAVLIERFLALVRARPQGARLVPRPRKHMVTHHGVLAPAASLRSRIVPQMAAGNGGEEVVGDCEPGEKVASVALGGLDLG
jgi:hypothetical protein